MHIIDDVRNADDDFPHVVLTIGSFDGIHLGHQLILREVVAAARLARGTPAVLTMRPHPREFFSPEHAPNLLTSEKKKLQLLEQIGIKTVFILPFNAETSAIEAAAFVEGIVVGKCGAKAVVVGHDCRFGKGAQGNFGLLEREGRRLGFTAKEVPPLIINGERVSSTLIRERLLQGDLVGAEELLGRKYSITGVVVKGRGIGVKLGFPTANLKPHHSAVPAQGVYIAEALVEGRRVPAAVNIGIAPTIRHEDQTIEAHLLDFNENIRDREIEIIFHRRIRPEKKFPTYEALIDQIRQDVEDTRDYFDT